MPGTPLGNARAVRVLPRPTVSVPPGRRTTAGIGSAPVNGSFAEYVIGSASYVGRLADNPDFVAMAPILCAGVTTYKGIKETEVQPGEWIAIWGAAEGKVHSHIHRMKLEDINQVFSDMKAGTIDGRMVMVF